MNRSYFFASICLLLFLLPACQKDQHRDPTDDELNEYGLIASVEDGPYPMYSVTIEFPERRMRQSFSLNIEAVDMDRDALNVWKGITRRSTT